MDVSVELVSVVVGLPALEPCVLVVDDATARRLPSGPLEQKERSLQRGTRRWVEELTGHQLGYVEQLYTFADADREDGDVRAISISYLGLTRIEAAEKSWVPWYELLPWEDHRNADESVTIVSDLKAWAGQNQGRLRRIGLTFGVDGHDWVPDLALQRYELMYEAGLIAEAGLTDAATGIAMCGDHRRMLATAMGRLRAKIQYRPVVFELLPEEFTLGELQRCVEAIMGQHTHTQNFRRLVDQQALVEPTGSVTRTGGRPAKLFRFREAVIDARAFAGTKLPTTRGGR